jgi:hypothetical protein
MTGLQWQKTFSVQTFTWSEASEYCSKLELADHQDWRLPTLPEALSIADYADYGQSNPIFGQLFGTKVKTLWTASADVSSGTNARWCATLPHGETISSDSYFAQHPVRCVRRETPLAPVWTAQNDRFLVDAANKTVYDNLTKLTWQREVPAGAVKASEAQNYCNVLSLSGGGWRLPTVHELTSIVDWSKHHPSVDELVLPTPNQGFWTSFMFVVTFDKGSVLYGSINSRMRCVR